MQDCINEDSWWNWGASRQQISQRKGFLTSDSLRFCKLCSYCLSFLPHLYKKYVLHQYEMDMLSGREIDFCRADADRGLGLKCTVWVFMNVVFYYTYLDARVAWLEVESANSHVVKVWKTNSFSIVIQKGVLEFFLTPLGIVYLEDYFELVKLLDTFVVDDEQMA